MKILITGSTGLLGQALCRALSGRHELTGLSRRPPATAGAAGHVACDLLDRQRLTRIVASARPDVVIHAQAMSNVDQCEEDPAQARAQNVNATANLVDALRGSSAALIAIGTDYVFDGQASRPYDEASPPNPVSVYGRSKLEAERVALQYPQAMVARVSTLFGPGRMNFCDAVVQAAQEGRHIEAFADQTTSPTYTLDAAEALGRVADILVAGGEHPRLVHVTNTGACTRVEFAHRVVEWLGKPRETVIPVSIAQLRRPAPRPRYSALGTTELPRVIGSTLRPWDEALHEYLRQHHCAN